MAYQTNIQDTALEVVKTLISTPQAELLEQCKMDGVRTVDGVVGVAFEVADAFHSEIARRAMADIE